MSFDDFMRQLLMSLMSSSGNEGRGMLGPVNGRQSPPLTMFSPGNQRIEQGRQVFNDPNHQRITQAMPMFNDPGHQMIRPASQAGDGTGGASNIRSSPLGSLTFPQYQNRPDGGTPNPLDLVKFLLGQ